MCFNSCYHATFTSKGITHHQDRIQELYHQLRLGSHENITKQKQSSKGSDGHQVHISIQLLQAGTNFDYNFDYNYIHHLDPDPLHCYRAVKPSVVVSPLAIFFCIIFQRRTSALFMPFSPLADFLLLLSRLRLNSLCYIAWMLHQRDQWHSLTFLMLCTRTSSTKI